jgi:hypothetical protein
MVARGRFVLYIMIDFTIIICTRSFQIGLRVERAAADLRIPACGRQAVERSDNGILI